MDMVEKARQRLAQIEAEAVILRQFLETSEAVAAVLGGAALPSHLRWSPSDKTVDASGDAQESVERTRVTDNPKPEVLIPAAKEILRANKRPMNRRQLHQALAARGLEVRGADPVKTLGTILWRARDQIKSIEGWGYWPKEDDFSPDLELLLS